MKIQMGRRNLLKWLEIYGYRLSKEAGEEVRLGMRDVKKKPSSDQVQALLQLQEGQQEMAWGELDKQAGKAEMLGIVRTAAPLDPETSAALEAGVGGGEVEAMREAMDNKRLAATLDTTEEPKPKKAKVINVDSKLASIRYRLTNHLNESKNKDHGNVPSSLPATCCR